MITKRIHRLTRVILGEKPNPQEGQKQSGLGMPLTEQIRRELSTRPDIDSIDSDIILRSCPLTMTSLERLIALIDSVRYLSRQKISGDIVECGVWRGGSIIAAALTLIDMGDTDRHLYLYDTFEGMPEPDEEKDISFDGHTAVELLESEPKGEGIWCEASMEEVRFNILSTGYPADKVHLVKGKVEQTIPKIMPAEIALLRLDTDWYESTLHELNCLYPAIVDKGILIVDDYGHWKGARAACDEFFENLSNPPVLVRIDYSGRIAQVS